MEKVKEVLGFGPKIKYGVVGCGDISQRLFMPSVAHTSNSVITALVTGDPEKAENLAKEYKVDKSHVYSYENFKNMLQDKVVDAIYLATPNWRHEEFAIPALKAGVHVLLEKPMEISVEKCERIIEAQKASSAKLMIAYRLHFEPATIALAERVRKGELGEIIMFTSTFTQMVDPKNHRAQNRELAGPVYDIGTYPLNAVRNLFQDEPIEVYAVGTRHPEAGFPSDFDDTVAVTLTFPHNRVAQFTLSFYGNGIDEYTVVGTKGCVHVCPAFMYDVGLEYNPVLIGEKRKHEAFKDTDQFAGECEYFSECILKGKDPECDGREGLADVRVLEAIIKSLQTKSPQKLAPRAFTNPLTTGQEKKIANHKIPTEEELTNAAPPARQ